MTQRIFGMGGVGFEMRPENDALHDYILELTGVPRPRICLLPTASGDPGEQIARFHEAFGSREAEASHVSLFRPDLGPAELREHLLAQDVIYVGGGSMVNLLALWSAHELDSVLRTAWEAGIVLSGVSAGSMCWFEAGITSGRGRPTVTRGLGFLPGSCCVHYDTELERRRVYLDAVAGDTPPGFGLDEGAGILFEGTQLVEAVSGRPEAGAYRVERRDGEVTETPLDARNIRPSGERSVPPDIAEYRAMNLERRLRAGRLG